MARIDLKQCTIALIDGTTPTPNKMNIKIGEGNFQWTEKKNVIYVKDRGLLSTVRKGDQEPVEVKFDAIYEFIEMAAADSPLVSVEDFLRKRGNAAGFITAGADPCMPFAVTLAITQNQNCPGTPTEIVTLPEFRFESINFDLRNGMLAVSGKCNVQFATIARV